MNRFSAKLLLLSIAITMALAPLARAVEEEIVVCNIHSKPDCPITKRCDDNNNGQSGVCVLSTIHPCFCAGD